MLQNITYIWVQMEQDIHDEIMESDEETLDDGVMNDDEFSAMVQDQIEDAANYIDEYISPERAEATKFYQGKPFGDEVEGRSQYVSQDLRDTVQAILPSLLKIFHSSERVVDFVPKGPEDVAIAEQQTDYVRFVFNEDNPGFMILHSAFKDMLIRRNGFIKAYWHEEKKVENYNYTGLDDMALNSLMLDPSLEVVSLSSSSVQGDLNSPPVTEHNATIRRTTTDGKIKIECLPPEEVLINRTAKDLSTARLIAHRRYMTGSDLMEMGYDYEDFEEHLGSGTNGDNLDYNQEYTARKPEVIDREETHLDESQRLVQVADCWVRMDYDGDGIAELRHVMMIGANYSKMLLNEPVSNCPIHTATCDPEPHDWTGMGMHDLLKDLQRVKSQVLRSTLDSLALSVHPRMTFVEGQANIDDLLASDAVGALIRTRSPGAVQPLIVPFVGQQALPVLGLFDEVKENRTGISKASMGLDPESLQSTTAVAVNATVSAAQQKIDLIARIVAEQLMKPLFKHILGLVCEHQDQPRMVRLRNEFVPIDPKGWNKNMDVSVNIGLGQSDEQKRMQALMAVKGSQEQILLQMGPENPLVNLSQYHRTLAKLAELAGFKDTKQFFTDPASVPPPPPEPPKPSPEEVLAQIEANKIQADMAQKAADIQMQEKELQAKVAMKQMELEVQVQLKIADLEGKHQTSMDTTMLKGQLETLKTKINQQTQIAVAGKAN